MPAHMRVLPRPAKGTAAKATRARRARIERVERAAKLAAKERDNHRCRRCGSRWQLESAHLVDKQMGGDHGRFSSEPKHFATLCHFCHHIVLHGHVERMEYDPEQMADGPISFVPEVGKTFTTHIPSCPLNREPGR